MKYLLLGLLIFVFCSSACGSVEPSLEPDAAALGEETAVSQPTDAPPPETNTPIPPASVDERLEIRATADPSTADLAPPIATQALVVNDLPEEIFTAVFDNLNAQTGLARESVTIIQAIPVTWPDGSLGCPQPGSMYTQALVEGYHVILQQGETTYDYRVTGGGFAMLCPSPVNIVPPASGTPDA